MDREPSKIPWPELPEPKPRQAMHWHQPPAADLIALQYHSDGQWSWTCDAGGYVIGFTADDLKRIGELPTETRRVPWAAVPAQLKRISECGNRKARRAERAVRRREAWKARKKTAR